jgi:hypothetical protein
MNEDDIAAVMMAGLASANLREIDKNTTQQASTGPANKLNPQSFIKGHQPKVDQQRQIIQDQINKEALERYPMPPPSVPVETQQTAHAPFVNAAPINLDPKTMAKIADAALIFAKAVDRVSKSLCNKLDKQTDSVIL